MLERRVRLARRRVLAYRREACARCTVARLMKAEGLRGVVRGSWVKTTIPSGARRVPPTDIMNGSESGVTSCPITRQLRSGRPWALADCLRGSGRSDRSLSFGHASLPNSQRSPSGCYNRPSGCHESVTATFEFGSFGGVPSERGRYVSVIQTTP